MLSHNTEAKPYRSIRLYGGVYASGDLRRLDEESLRAKLEKPTTWKNKVILNVMHSTHSTQHVPFHLFSKSLVLRTCCSTNETKLLLQLKWQDFKFDRQKTHKPTFTLKKAICWLHTCKMWPVTLTSRKKSTAMTWKVGLILRMVWISFHSLATKYVLQILTGDAWLFPSPDPQNRTTPLQNITKCYWKVEKNHSNVITFNVFTGFTARSFPVYKENIHRQLHKELMEKLHCL